MAADPEWDWLRFTSGEWLKGELRGMEDDSLEFDSDELDVITVDWDDVDAVYTHRPMAVLLIGGEIVIGRLQTHDGKILIGSREHQVDPGNILGIAIGAPRGIDLWHGTVSAGLSLRSGNVEQRDVDISMRFTRRTAKSTVRLSYTGNFTENDDIESANDHRATSTYDYRISRKWFVRPLNAEFYRDKFQNIDAQWHAGFGASYYVIENSTTLWTISGGPGYQETTYIEVPAGEDRRTSSPIILVGTEYDRELTSSVDVYGAYDVTFTNEDSGSVLQHITMSLDVDIIGDLDLKVAAYIDHTESPQADADGNFPDKTDARLTVGIAYDL